MTVTTENNSKNFFMKDQRAIIAPSKYQMAAIERFYFLIFVCTAMLGKCCKLLFYYYLL